MSVPAGGPALAGPPSSGAARGEDTRERYDEAEGYCRMLGHAVRFGYCRTGTGQLPCGRIADCWFERIPIEDFLRRHYTPQELGTIFTPRPGKLASILEIVQNVTARRSAP